MLLCIDRLESGQTDTSGYRSDADVCYYDRYEKLENENPTIGILLCKEKNDALVEITLPKDANIYASEYKLYLPDKKLLQQKLKEWIEEEEE